MTVSAAERSGTEERRIRVVRDRVACWRIGSVGLDRCRECLYLVRLEAETPDTPGHVVCTNAFLEAEPEFVW
ncbi:MAG: hypothetical protein ABJC24_03315 [Chloroflexota bacterium]